MFHLLMLVLAIALAIPTFGISLVVFFIVANWLTKTAAKPIMVAMYTSYKTDSEITLPHRSFATIRKAFRLLNVQDYEEESYPGMGLKTFVGSVQHPMHHNPLFVQIHCQRVPGEQTYITIGSKDVRAGAQEWLDELTKDIR